MDFIRNYYYKVDSMKYMLFHIKYIKYYYYVSKNIYNICYIIVFPLQFSNIRIVATLMSTVIKCIINVANTSMNEVKLTFNCN
jgi:hypothetical protein